MPSGATRNATFLRSNGKRWITSFVIVILIHVWSTGARYVLAACTDPCTHFYFKFLSLVLSFSVSSSEPLSCLLHLSVGNKMSLESSTVGTLYLYLIRTCVEQVSIDCSSCVCVCLGSDPWITFSRIVSHSAAFVRDLYSAVYWY